MRAFLSVKFHPDHSNGAHIEALCQALAEQGFEPVCVVRDLEHWGAVHYEAKELMQHTRTLLESCQVVVVDLKEKGVGIGIEAGLAWARDIPVVVIAPVGAEISETLRSIARAVCSYLQPNNLPRIPISN